MTKQLTTREYLHVIINSLLIKSHAYVVVVLIIDHLPYTFPSETNHEEGKTNLGRCI